MNFENFNADNKKTSIKCHHPPGGSSSFSMGWENNQMNPGVKGTSNKNKESSFNIFNGQSYQSVNEEDKENVSVNKISDFAQTQMTNNGPTFFDNFNDSSKTSSIKTNYETGKPQYNIFNSDNSNDFKQNSSIKVSNTPGGKSTVFFGNPALRPDST